MARPVCETPILYGEDARRFKSRLQNPPKETAEQREQCVRHFNAVMSVFKG